MTLFRGDDTDAFGNKFITITLATPISVTITKAIFQCGIIEKEFINPTFPLEVELTAAETKTLGLQNKCYLAVWDEDDKKRTCEGFLTFSTKGQVVND